MKLLAVARDLQRRRARERGKMAVVEGVRGVEEVLSVPALLRGALVAPALATTPRGRALRAALERTGATHGFPVQHVDDESFASAAGTDSPQGALAIIRIPEQSFENVPPGGSVRLIVLDGVQDPGNAGTIVRTAAALGIAAVIALPGTVDLWNPKVVRSAMGALLRVPAFHATVPELAAWSAASGTAVWAAAAGGEPIAIAASGAPARLAVILGNEGGGISPGLTALAARTVSIPMEPGAESLNVAVAAGIISYALHP